MDISDVIHSGGVQPTIGSSSKKVQPVQTEKTGKVRSEVQKIDRAEIDRIARDDARVLEGARLVLEALSDVRAEKVEEARKRLAEGYYKGPDVKAQIAKNMMEDPEIYPVVPPISGKIAKEINQKIDDKFYERKEVKEEVARGLVDDARQDE